MDAFSSASNFSSAVPSKTPPPRRANRSRRSHGATSHSPGNFLTHAYSQPDLRQLGEEAETVEAEAEAAAAAAQAAAQTSAPESAVAQAEYYQQLYMQEKVAVARLEARLGQLHSVRVCGSVWQCIAACCLCCGLIYVRASVSGCIAA